MAHIRQELALGAAGCIGDLGLLLEVIATRLHLFEFRPVAAKGPVLHPENVQQLVAAVCSAGGQQQNGQRSEAGKYANSGRKIRRDQQPASRRGGPGEGELPAQSPSDRLVVFPQHILCTPVFSGKTAEIAYQLSPGAPASTRARPRDTNRLPVTVYNATPSQTSRAALEPSRWPQDVSARRFAKSWPQVRLRTRPPSTGSTIPVI